MLVDTGSRGPLWVSCLGPRQSAPRNTSENTCERRLSTSCIFRKKWTESYSFNAGDVSCASPQDWRVQSRTSCHVSKAEWQGGGRWPQQSRHPATRVLWEAHYGALTRLPAEQWGAPSCRQGPRLPGSDTETQGDPACSTPPPLTPGLSLADFHPQLPNSILLRLCHRPISRRILSMVLFIMKELSRPLEKLLHSAVSHNTVQILFHRADEPIMLPRYFIIVCSCHFISITRRVYSVGSVRTKMFGDVFEAVANRSRAVVRFWFTSGFLVIFTSGFTRAKLQPGRLLSI